MEISKNECSKNKNKNIAISKLQNKRISRKNVKIEKLVQIDELIQKISPETLTKYGKKFNTWQGNLLFRTLTHSTPTPTS